MKSSISGTNQHNDTIPHCLIIFNAYKMRVEGVLKNLSSLMNNSSMRLFSFLFSFYFTIRVKLVPSHDLRWSIFLDESTTIYYKHFRFFESLFNSWPLDGLENVIRHFYYFFVICEIEHSFVFRQFFKWRFFFSPWRISLIWMIRFKKKNRVR